MKWFKIPLIKGGVRRAGGGGITEGYISGKKVVNSIQIYELVSQDVEKGK